MQNRAGNVQKGRVISRRLFILAAAKLLLFAGITSRLYNLQISDREKYKILSDKNRIRSWKTPPQRGLIKDYYDKILADNDRVFQVHLSLDQIEDFDQNENFDKKAQGEFLKGAQIAYETIITDFSDDDNKLIKSKPLLSKKIHDQFNQALQERNNKGFYAEITFIGINSANIKEHKKTNNILKVTVDFVSEIITCIKDKEKKIISGDAEKIKKIYDTWVFSRDTKSINPNWQLVDILT